MGLVWTDEVYCIIIIFIGGVRGMQFCDFICVCIIRVYLVCVCVCFFVVRELCTILNWKYIFVFF